MAEQVLTYRLTSIDRLVMNNYQPARRAKYEPNPDDPMRSQYIEHLYMRQDGPVIPSDMVVSMLVLAAIQDDQTEIAKAGIACVADVPLEYDGPRTADGLWFERTFAAVIDLVFYPAFPAWAATVVVTIDTEIVSPDQVDRWMEHAGRYVGLGDMRFAATKAWELADKRLLHGRFRAERS